ncbi:MAG: N-hydroxyarylamine O-acetyltransferase [Gammaproteobacteria bacterium]|jgi:N-hydroxyarylamine O-acetyltransferase
MPDTELPPSPQWIQRYLSLLGVPHNAPDMAALTELVRAHVLSVPFENVTSLLRWRDHATGPVPAPAPETLLKAWECKTGGGLCFEICMMFARLLRALGYQAQIVLGQISVPFGHQAILVELDGSRYLLDLGNGAPLFEPVALDGAAVEIHRHGLSYRFRHGEHDMSLIQERVVGSAWGVHCRYDLNPSRDADRDQGYRHHHTANASWVTGTLTMVRSSAEKVVALRDSTLSRFTAAGKTVEQLSQPVDFQRVAVEEFNLPLLPIGAALDVRAQLLARSSDAVNQ